MQSVGFLVTWLKCSLVRTFFVYCLCLLLARFLVINDIILYIGDIRFVAVLTSTHIVIKNNLQRILIDVKMIYF